MPYEKIGDNEPVCIADEVPFEIPESWEWVRLKNITTLLGGYAFKSDEYTEKGVRVIRISDFNDNGLIDDEFKYYPEIDELNKYLIIKNDILMCMTGGTVGKTCIITSLSEKLYLNQRVANIRCNKQIECLYIYLVCISYYIQEIVKSSKTSTNDNISMDTIGNFLIPLPPINEQTRIINQYYNYLPLIDKYDSLETELNKLNAEFPEKLKKSILQQAIQGKLVEQNSSDESASVLLEKIRKEKEKLIKEGKIKKDKNESIIYKRDNSYYEKLNGVEKCIDDEIPFEIPESWEWCRLENLSFYITKGTTPRGGKVQYINNGIGFLRAENVIGYKQIDIKNLLYITDKIHKGYLKRSILCEGDVLITIAGTLGRTGIVKKEYLPLNTNQAVSIVRLTNLINKICLIYFINSPYIQKSLISQRKITAIPNLTLELISKCLLPIPPLCEQQKIVNKIEKLFNEIIN